MKCLLLDIEMPIGKRCPSAYNEDGFECYEGCGCADNPELIAEKVRNWEEIKKRCKEIIKEDRIEELRMSKETV